MSVSILFAHEKVASVEDAIDHLESCNIWNLFDKRAVSFINKFSTLLLKYPDINQYPDLVALAFWFRRANIHKLEQHYTNDKDVYRVGRGISLHIAPSNVDTIFVYSFFLSLLAGNSSFIRVSQNGSPQIDIIIQLFQDLYDAGETETAGRFVICTYPHEDTTTELVSKLCELRVIWGGDETVSNITSIPLNPTALEIKFPNRASFSAINLSTLNKTTDKELIRLCEKFYADIQLFGQQACSSPLALYFIGSSGPCEQYKRFWDFFTSAAKSHKLSASEVMDRYVSVSSMAISGVVDRVEVPFSHDKVILLNGGLTSEISFRDGHPGNGSIVQFFLPQLADLTRYIRPKDQTLSIYGFSLGEVGELLASLSNRGLDRVVPIGQALEFSNIWDGYDLIDSMSRKIDVSKIK
ncbi:MAG: acyl-CoA reductase [Saprospiraceae bacterium]|nr:acyl-CoA reductase [Saprospiraceae bacterium]